MVYNSKTFEVLHELTHSGKVAYRRMLEMEGSRILMYRHPIKYLCRYIKRLVFATHDWIFDL